MAKVQQAFIVISTLFHYGISRKPPSCLKTMFPESYGGAIKKYPTLAPALQVLAKQKIARWYTDRVSNPAQLAKDVYLDVCESNFKNLNKTLEEISVKPIVTDFDASVVVAYGLPHKDCADKFSSNGSNKNVEDYKEFLQNLVDGNVNKKNVIYILEPDAIGLLGKEACAKELGYDKNLRIAIDILSNDYSKIYIEVGFWMLMTDSEAEKIAKIVNEVDPEEKCSGIALNTANYRTAKEMNEYCLRFRKFSGRKNVTCVVDTSRNNLPPSKLEEWCNFKTAGIGQLPTYKTDYPAIDAFMWIKPAGESDGQCVNRTSDSLKGPTAGEFFPDFFLELWNNGILVSDYGYPEVSLDNSWTSSEPGKKHSKKKSSRSKGHRHKRKRCHGKKKDKSV